MKKAVKIIVPIFRVSGDSIKYPIDIFRLNAPFVDYFSDLDAVLLGIPVSTKKELAEEILSESDGVLFQGGHDIHPKFFAPEEDVHKKVYYLSEERDEFEINFVKKAYELKKPILGVCRGIQIINVAFGGTIWQDQPSENPTNVMHFPNKEGLFEKVTKDDIFKEAHNVTLKDGSFIKSVFQKDKVMVNSLHHQALKNVGDGLKITAVSEDGIVEAIENKNENDGWVLGVQWHPEFSEKLPDHNLHKKIFEKFVDVCKSKKSG